MPIQPMPAHTQSLRFQGAKTTRAVQERWMSPDDVKYTVAQDTDPYVGQLPSKFLKGLGLTPEQGFQLMDEIARKNPPMSFWQKFLKDFIPQIAQPNRRMTSQLLQNSPNPLKIKYLGSGDFGDAYRLSAGSEQPAQIVLKILNHENELQKKNVYAEIANGAYLSITPTRDIAKFYAARACDQTHPWLVSENIDYRTDTATRRGKSLEERGFAFEDDSIESNRVYGVRVDFGGLVQFRPEAGKSHFQEMG